MDDTIARAVFGLLFDSSPDAALLVFRDTGVIASANERAADMLSRATDLLVGMPIADLAADPLRDTTAPGRYEDIVFVGGDGYPVYATLQVAHVDHPSHGALAAYIARDISERRLLECEVMAKHTALFTAHAELERAHAQLTETKAELERRNHEIAMLAYRAATGELVAGIAHHLNNPVGALSSTLRRLEQTARKTACAERAELERLVGRASDLARRIESNVAAIVSASKGSGKHAVLAREVPAELAGELSSLAERLDDIPTKGDV